MIYEPSTGLEYEDDFDLTVGRHVGWDDVDTATGVAGSVNKRTSEAPRASQGPSFEDRWNDTTRLFTPAQMQNFDTRLQPDEEVKFQEWKKQHAPNDSGFDYDFRGAFLRGFLPAADGPDVGHWPDTFKKPWHETFSNESIYAKDAPGLAGEWIKHGDNLESFAAPGGEYSSFEKATTMYAPADKKPEVEAEVYTPDKHLMEEDQLHHRPNQPFNQEEPSSRNELKYAEEQMENRQVFADRLTNEHRDGIEAHNDYYGPSHYRHNIASETPERRQDRLSITQLGRERYNLELRRSPADGTFRSFDEFADNWEQFTRNYDGSRSSNQSVRQVEEDIGRRLTAREREYVRSGGFAEDPRTPSEVFDTDGTFRAPRGWESVEADPNAQARFKAQFKDLEFTTKDGKPGVLESFYNKDTKTIYIDWMGMDRGKRLQEYIKKNPGKNANIHIHELGAPKVKEMLKQLAEAFPEAEKLDFERISGARGRARTTGRVQRYIHRDEKGAPIGGGMTRMPGPPKPGGGMRAPGQSIDELY